MSKPLVIVESPAKAKPSPSSLAPGSRCARRWGTWPTSPAKACRSMSTTGSSPPTSSQCVKDVVKDLRAAMKDASELYLATDEDREGEAISWHLLEYLKPKVPVKRMVFHEITKSAIDHAVANPQPGLRPRRCRRDPSAARPALRLRGVTGAVAPSTAPSAGRAEPLEVPHRGAAQRERIAFVTAGYWDIDLLTGTTPAFHRHARRGRWHEGRHRQGLHRRRATEEERRRRHRGSCAWPRRR